MKKRTAFRIILALPALAAVSIVGLLGLFWLDMNLADQGWEFGYYGQFNRVKHVIEEMPNVSIVDHWQHKDVRLEDFGFTLRLSDAREVDLRFHDGTPEKNERNKDRLRRIIQNQIDSNNPRARHVWETTPGGPYAVTVTEVDITCEHPKRPKESIRWDAVTEIRLVTTSEGPFQPDAWYLFLGETGGCSVPAEAQGFAQLWPVLERRFPGVDYGAIISAGTADNQKVLWTKGSNKVSEVMAPNLAEPQG